MACFGIITFGVGPTLAQPASIASSVRVTDPHFTHQVLDPVGRILGLSGCDLLGSMSEPAWITGCGAIDDSQIESEIRAAELSALDREILRSLCEVFQMTPAEALQDPLFRAPAEGERLSAQRAAAQWPTTELRRHGERLVANLTQRLSAWPGMVERRASDHWMAAHQRSREWWTSVVQIGVPANIQTPRIKANFAGHAKRAKQFGIESQMLRPSGYRPPSGERLPRSAAPLAPLGDLPFESPREAPEIRDNSTTPSDAPQSAPLIPIERPLFWEVFSLKSLHRQWTSLAQNLAQWPNTLPAWPTQPQSVPPTFESQSVPPTLGGAEGIAQWVPSTLGAWADWMASTWRGSVGRGSVAAGANSEVAQTLKADGHEGEEERVTVQPVPTASYVGLESSIQWLAAVARSTRDDLAAQSQRLAEVARSFPAGQKSALSRLVLERFDAIRR
jgi:hypothetical protein